MAAPSEPVRVLLVDDHQVVRIGLRTILTDEPQISVVGEAANAADGLRQVSALQPDVVILDIRLPDLSGIELCRQLKTRSQTPKVLMLTSYGDEDSVLNALDAGADGYMLKDLEQCELGASILAIAHGGTVIDPVIARMLVSSSRGPRRTPGALGSGLISSPEQRLARLSGQELRVMSLLAQGKVNKEIATELQLAEGTVRNMLTTIYSKLEVPNRSSAVALWLQARLRS